MVTELTERKEVRGMGIRRNEEEGRGRSIGLDREEQREIWRQINE